MTARSLPKPSLPSPRSLAAIATVLSVPFLSFYWMNLIRLVPDATMARAPQWLSPLSPLLYLPFAFFAHTLFGNLYVYVLTAMASVTTAIVGLMRGRGNGFLRVWLLVVMCGTVAFPLLFRYQPALVAAPGCRMHLVTDPGFMGRIVKASQNLVERTPCEYELLGWSADNWLYYRAICGGAKQTWRYAPARPGDDTQVSSLPATLSAPTISESLVLEMVRADGVRPEEVGPVTRPVLLKSEGIASADGRWVAAVTQHVYGTQDVIVLTADE